MCVWQFHGKKVIGFYLSHYLYLYWYVPQTLFPLIIMVSGADPECNKGGCGLVVTRSLRGGDIILFYPQTTTVSLLTKVSIFKTGVLQLLLTTIITNEYLLNVSASSDKRESGGDEQDKNCPAIYLLTIVNSSPLDSLITLSPKVKPGKLDSCIRLDSGTAWVLFMYLLTNIDEFVELH